MMESFLSIGLGHYLALSGVLFAIGLLGVVLNRRNAIVWLMAVELMMLSATLNFVAFSQFLGVMAGQVFAMIALTVAAAETAIGLAILVIAFRQRGNIGIGSLRDLKG